MIDTPGIYEIDAATYHADPCPAPSLSSSVARVLVECSPLHAWTAHPRLNPAHVREESEAFDLGTAVHAYLLEGADNFAIIDAPDWRTKAAKEARDAAREEGKVPLLAHRWADVRGMAAAARESFKSCERPTPLTAGAPERTLIWREGPVWCRARLDWLHDDHRTIDDLKSTSVTANPEVWTRTLFNTGYDLQAAWYLRGLKAVTGQDARFRFVVIETTPPYACSLIGLSPEALMLAEKKCLMALELWAACLETNVWPGYPTRVCYAELPGYEEARWLAKEEATL